MKNTGIMIDCSRNAVPRPKTIKRMADIMNKLGFNTLMLYTEDTYEIEGQPYFGYLRGRYSAEEIRDIDSCCRKLGIELIPCIQTLAHLNGIARWKKYESIIDCNDILLVGDERTYELIEEMFRAVSKMFTSKKIHIGMDEAWMLGAGQYLKKNGYKKQKEIMKEHLRRVAEIAERYGFEPMIWSDMFFQISIGSNTTDDPSVVDEALRAVLPENIAPVYWDYYSLDKEHYDSMMRAHKNFGRPFWFAGGLWTWSGFAPHNLFSIKAAKASVASCKENGTDSILFTIWGDDGAEASIFSVLPAMYYASCLIKGVDDEAEIKRGFEKMFGIAFDDFMLMDIPEITASERNIDLIVDPDKYMLYSDPFLGIFDSIADKDNNGKYAETAHRLECVVNDKNFGYIFRTIQSLCEVLAVKNDLGVRTREAYMSGSKERLKALIADYKTTERRLNSFLDNFRKQWLLENKPFGLEVQETRLGGLAARIRSCKERIESYISGSIGIIEELEENILDPECKESSGKREVVSRKWREYFIGSI